MDRIYLFGAIVILAYGIQILLGMRQLKHFNQVYMRLRKKGRVAIGRRAGKIKSGTIVLFALDQQGRVLEACKMQGVTVLAHFKDMPDYVGQDIHYLDSYNPLVRKENKLLQIAIEDAREVFLRVEAGNYEDVPKSAPLIDLGLQAKVLANRFKLGRNHIRNH